MSLNEKLTAIQNGLRVTKDKVNTFGKYTYRSAEMIYEAVKPLCLEQAVTLTIEDDIVLIGERFYVKATATITDGQEVVTRSAFAREPQDVKGQSEAQITGATSSYARKYALGGLFLLDDNKDADETNTHGKEPVAQPKDQKKLNELVDLFETLKPEVKTTVLKNYKIKDIVELPVDLWDRAIKGMSK